jgi:outer membrane protein assembly factor BamB
MPTIIFCPDCNTFLDSQAAACPACGRKRPPSERLPEPGQPLWLRYVEGAIHSAVIAGSLVVCNAGERNKPCGVYAFEQATGEQRWYFPTRHSVEAAVSLYENRLYFATCGFLGSGAELFCLEAETGQEIWKKDLTAGVWSRPLVDEARVYIGQEDGQVLCFANRDGTPLCYQPVGLPRGRIWLEMVEGALLALSSRGQILALNPLALERVWHTPLEVEHGITSPPCAVDGRLFFGGEGGQLFRLDVRSRKITPLARVQGSIVAAPAYSDGILFFGAVSKSEAHEHYLHACDPDTGQPLWKSPKFPHSLSSQPHAGEGLVAAGFTQFGLVLLDARTGEFAWDFPVRSEARLLSHPILHEGVIYAGTDTGQVFALPWHLGKYDWAARLCKDRGDCEKAGSFYVLAAQNTLKEDKKGQYYQQAVACWQEAGKMELAGHLWEGLIEEENAAGAYIQAGQQWKDRDKQRAAEYYNLAAQLYHLLDNEKEEKTCAQLAQKLALGPLLRIKPWTNPTMTQYREGRITFRVENVGRRDAVDLSLNLGGSLVDPVTCVLEDPLPAGANSYFDVTLTITPTKAQNELVIQAEYGAAGAKKHFFSTSHAVVEAAEAPIEVEMKDVVALKGIQITNPQNRRIHYKLDGVIAPIINFNDTLPMAKLISVRRCPACGASLPEGAEHCDQCGAKI